MKKPRNRKRKGITFKCANCGVDAYKSPFIAKRNTKNNFCSMICRREFSKGEIVNCMECNTLVHLTPFRVKNSKSPRHFCSYSCKSKYEAKTTNILSRITSSKNFNPNGYWLGKKRPPMPDEWRKKISVASKGRKPPPITEETREKMSKSQTGKIMSESTRQKMSLYRKGKVFRSGFKHSLETRTKMSLKRKRENHWNWQGGKIPLKDSIRHTFQYKNWRTSVFIRDNRTCVWCGSKKDIEADHIKPYVLIRNENNIKTIEDAISCDELWDTNNGRTLCKECHKKTDTYLNKVKKYLPDGKNISNFNNKAA